MTVIEREQVREVVAPVTETERRARILEAAALEIEVRGWCQGLAQNGAGNVCLLGAMSAAAGQNPSQGWMEMQHQAIWFGSMGRCPSIYLLFCFNDEHAATAEEVTFLLRWRAQEIRDGWDA